MQQQSEPHNPFYLLLLLASLLFVVTALAYAIVPVMEDRARQAGVAVPPDGFRAALRRHGGTWLLVQVAVMIVLGLASMWLDRQRLHRSNNATNLKTTPAQATDSSPASAVAPEERSEPERGTVKTHRLRQSSLLRRHPYRDF